MVHSGCLALRLAWPVDVLSGLQDWPGSRHPFDLTRVHRLIPYGHDMVRQWHQCALLCRDAGAAYHPSRLALQQYTSGVLIMN